MYSIFYLKNFLNQLNLYLFLQIQISLLVIISRLTLAVYVDEIFIVGEHKKDIVYVKQLFKECFEVKVLKEV